MRARWTATVVIRDGYELIAQRWREMGEQTFEVRFGELRSLLQGEASQVSYEAALEVLEGMSEVAPARLRVEALPYAQEVFERWYGAHPVGLDAGPLVAAGERASRALMMRRPWMRAVRGLDLTGLREERVFKELGRAGALLEGVEWLSLRDASPPEGAMQRVLRRAALPGLRALDVWAESRAVGLCVCERALVEGLEALSIWSAFGEDAEVVLGIEGLRALSVVHMTGGGISEWLSVARWAQLRELRLEHSAFVFEEAACEALLGRGWPLEVLRLGDVQLSREQVEVFLEGIGGLKELWARASARRMGGVPGARPLPLARVLSGRLGASLESLELSVVEGEDEMFDGGERLERLVLRGCEASAAQLLARGAERLGRLETLVVEAPPRAEGAVWEALGGARFGRLRVLRVGALTEGAQVEALARGGLCEGVETLCVWMEARDVASVVEGLLAAEGALGGVARVEVPEAVHEQVAQRAAGTWLAPVVCGARGGEGPRP